VDNISNEMMELFINKFKKNNHNNPENLSFDLNYRVIK
jgi:hypothetical protein